MTMKIRASKTIRIYGFLAFLMIFILVGCTENETQKFTGTIEWTAKAKDMSSLCYSYTFIRSEDRQMIGVQFKNSRLERVFSEKFSGKAVEIEGYFVTKEREFSGIKQRPLNINGQPEPIICHYFSVSEVYLAKQKPQTH
jgi:hypothetical protein